MKLFFIEARSKAKVKITDKAISKLPQKVAVAAAVQYIGETEKVMERIKATGREAGLAKGWHSKHDGQVLGCGWANLKMDIAADAVLFIGTGKFHPEGIALGFGGPIFQYDPENNAFKDFDRSKVDFVKKKMKVNKIKFLYADRVGVVVSTKVGQNQYVRAKSLEKKYPDKEFFYLGFDTIDFIQLGNFPFIEVFVNTACNRLVDDFEKFPKPMVNIENVE